jgi:hypothetical protein
VTTWLASPHNIILDLLALPFINKGIYQLEDLSPAYQAEISELLTEAESNDVVGQLAGYLAELPRVMFFFKWYGKNLKTAMYHPFIANTNSLGPSACQLSAREKIPRGTSAHSVPLFEFFIA